MNVHKLRLAASGFLKEKHYWEEKLGPVSRKTIFPVDQSSEDYMAEEVSMCFNAQVTERLIQLSSGSEHAIHVYLLSNLAVVMHKYSMDTEFIIGTPIYEQNEKAELINAILPICCSVAPELTFKELLFQIRHNLVEANQNQNYPIELLASDLEFPDSDTIFFPLLDVVLMIKNLHNEMHPSRIAHNLTYSFDLSDVKSFECTLKYNSFKYSKKSAQYFLRRFFHVLCQVLIKPEIKISKLSLTTQAEQLELLELGRGDKLPILSTSLIGQFQNMVQKWPETVAVTNGFESLTYFELDMQSNQIAATLYTAGKRKNSCIGIMIDNSPTMLVVLLGILKTGLAFLPINPDLPASRIQYMLKDSDVSLVATVSKLSKKLDDCDVDLFCVDVESSDVGQAPPAIEVNDDDLAYVIYTSGTSGKPKGVMITYGAFKNYVGFAVQNYMTEEIRNVGLFTSLSFDLTLTSIFPPLVSGRTVIVYQEKDVSEQLKSIVRENRVQFIKATPSHLQILLMQSGNFKNNQMKRIVVGGEQLFARQVEGLSHLFRNKVQVINEYGPTETTIGCTNHIYRQAGSNLEVPIGQPIQNMNIYLLDENLRPVPQGSLGRIWISGKGLSKGYLNNKDLTIQKYQTFNYGVDEVIYDSGDIGIWMKSGELKFVGRNDTQVKIRGFRVELHEIKNIVTGHPSVKDVEVVVKKDSSGDDALCAYIIYEQNPITQKDWIVWLKNELPGYMIPQYFITLEHWPLTLNGKLNAKALPEIQYEKIDKKDVITDKIELKLALIWASILGIDSENIGVNDDFFMLGGQSIKGIKMAAQIHRIFEVSVNLVEIFEKKTIAEIAKLIKLQNKKAFSPIPKANSKEQYKVTSSQLRFYSLQQLSPQSTAYNLTQIVRLKSRPKIEAIQGSFNKLVATHEILRTYFVEKNGGLFQKIKPSLKITVNEIVTDADNFGTTIKNCITAFKLGSLPLLRVFVVYDQVNEQAVMITDMHHILIDGISQRILSEQFLRLYEGHEILDTTLQYKDYSEWISDPQLDEQLRQSETYWLKEFEFPVKKLQLPILSENLKTSTSDSKFINYGLSPELTSKIRRTAIEKGITTNVLVLAAYFLMLQRIGMSNDITVGIPTSGRIHPDLENVIGLFLNTIVLRVTVDEQSPVQEFLRLVNHKSVLAISHQYYPFEKLVKKLDLKREKGQNPLFDVAYSYNDSDMFVRSEDTSEFENGPSYNDGKISKFDLTLHVILYDESLELNFEYNSGKLMEHTVAFFIQLMLSFIEQITEDTAIQIKSLRTPHTMVNATSTGLTDEINFSF